MSTSDSTAPSRHSDQVTTDQAIEVVSVDFTTQHRPDRAQLLSRLLLGPIDQKDTDAFEPEPAA